jgi:zona occludens toxin
MIVLVTGPPGAGKSLYALRQLGDALDRGKPVATNVELAAGAAATVARSNWARRILRRVPRATARIERQVYVSSSLVDLFSVRLRGRGEDRGVMVLDEAHYWLNARNWSSGDREAVVTFFTQHRKLGWKVFLVVQDAEMIDKQVRSLIEYHVHLRNLKKAKVLFGLLPASPVNLFLAVWTWHGIRGKPVKRELYRLSWHRRLYDTFQTHHGLEADGPTDELAAVWLPAPDPAGGPAGAKRLRGRRLRPAQSADAGQPGGGETAGEMVSVARNPTDASGGAAAPPAPRHQPPVLGALASLTSGGSAGPAATIPAAMDALHNELTPGGYRASVTNLSDAALDGQETG